LKINIVIGHALPFPPIKGGGIENLYYLLSRALAKLGHYVVVYSRLTEGLKRCEIDSHRIKHIRLKGYDWASGKFRNGLNSLLWCLRLRNVMEAADVTMFNTLFSFLLLEKKKYGALIYTLHRTPNWKLKLFKHFDRIYCGSDAVKSQALKICPKMKNIKRIYNCIEIRDEFPAKDPEKGRLTFIYVGRFVKDKGLEPLIKGFQKSLELFPENRLLTLGPQKDEDGADTEFFHTMLGFVQEHRLERNISLLPPIYDKRLLYSKISESDVVCIPSLWGETFSMAVLEAMMLAKPVLVSDFGPMPEAVEHLRTGFITRAGDAESICEGIKYFSRNCANLPQMGKAAKNKALSEFSSQKIAQEYLQDFRSLMARKSFSK